MPDPKSRLELLARAAARLKYAPDLVDEACRRAAESLDTLDDKKLAVLLKPQGFTPEQTDLLLKIFPPDRLLSRRGDAADGPSGVLSS